MDTKELVTAFSNLLLAANQPKGAANAIVSLNDVSDVFYTLAVNLQNGDERASEIALIMVQRAIEKKLDPKVQPAFRSNCGLLYWGE